jgi:hypothetical protein
MLSSFIFKLLAYFVVDFHGTEGPLPVDIMATTLLADKFILAGQELGYEHVDISGKNQLGKRPVDFSGCRTKLGNR